MYQQVGHQCFIGQGRRREKTRWSDESQLLPSATALDRKVLHGVLGWGGCKEARVEDCFTYSGSE